jgi:hypothetical protein
MEESIRDGLIDLSQSDYSIFFVDAFFFSAAADVVRVTIIHLIAPCASDHPRAPNRTIKTLAQQLKIW